MVRLENSPILGLRDSKQYYDNVNRTDTYNETLRLAITLYDDDDDANDINTRLAAVLVRQRDFKSLNIFFRNTRKSDAGVQRITLYTVKTVVGEKVIVMSI